MDPIPVPVAAAALLAAACLAGGCGSPLPPVGALSPLYTEALARTGPDKVAPPAAGSEEERAAMAAFTDFYREYSTAQIQKGVRGLYAADAYFGDPFKSVQGIDAVEVYFLKMAEPVTSCTFSVDGMGRSAEGDYYIRWTMDLTVRRNPDEPIRTLGMSHVRFNRQGQVVFQQDYWDAGALYERLPIVGSMVRTVRRRLE